MFSVQLQIQEKLKKMKKKEALVSQPSLSHSLTHKVILCVSHSHFINDYFFFFHSIVPTVGLSIGQRIQQARAAKGWSQKDLAVVRSPLLNSFSHIPPPLSFILFLLISLSLSWIFAHFLVSDMCLIQNDRLTPLTNYLLSYQ
jgi:hypothetical protein